MEWSTGAKEFLESRREKIPGNAAEIDKVLRRIEKDSEKAAEMSEADMVEKEHVKQAISGLPDTDVVSEGAEGSFGFIKAVVILAAVFLVVGLYTELWYRDLMRYGEEPSQNEEVIMLRWMLWVGIIMFVIAGLFYVKDKRGGGEEMEWEEGEFELDEEEVEAEEASPQEQ